MIEKMQHSSTHFGRDLAPGMLHRHAPHGEAVSRISWCVAQRHIGVITGEVGPARPSRSARPCPLWTLLVTRSSICLIRRSGSAASITRSSPRWAGSRWSTTPPWSRRPRTRWPPSKQNGAAPRSWSSTRRICSIRPSWSRSGC
jgi:hypothetical protein